MAEREDTKMPLTSHLEELRKRLVRILIGLGIGFIGCWEYRDFFFKIITKPLVDVLPKTSTMVFTGLPEAFFIYMKIAFFASLFITSPFTLYQIWKFISPGLYKSEKKYVIPFVASTSMLFIGGILFGYYIALPPAFKFFLEFSSDFLKPMISFREYLSLILKFLLAFGVCFELPVFIFFMAKIGIVNAAMLRKQRRYAILIIFVVAAILTPSPDAISQIIMAIPLMFLYEISIFLAVFAQRKRNKDKGEAKEESAT